MCSGHLLEVLFTRTGQLPGVDPRGVEEDVVPHPVPQLTDAGDDRVIHSSRLISQRAVQ